MRRATVWQYDDLLAPVCATGSGNGLVLLLMYPLLRKIVFPSDLLLAAEGHAHATKTTQQTDSVFHSGIGV